MRNEAIKSEEAIAELNWVKAHGFKSDDNIVGTKRIKESFDIAIKSLEDAEKYRWHNLRNNPDDLPKEDGEYYAYQYCYYCRTSDPDSEVCEPMYTIIFVKDGKIDNCYDEGEIIAWREIKSFEVEE